MNILADFKALLEKGNAWALAVGVAVGMAVFSFVHEVISDLLTPLLSSITDGMNSKYLKIGNLLEHIIEFAAVLAGIYAIFCILLPMLFCKGNGGKALGEPSAPPPPPPAA